MIFPAERPWYIYRGDSDSLTCIALDANGDPVDLTNYTGLAQIRATEDSVTVLAALTVTMDPDQVTYEGRFTITLSDTESAKIDSNAVWDCEFTDGSGNVQTILTGDVILTKDVSKA